MEVLILIIVVIIGLGLGLGVLCCGAIGAMAQFAWASEMGFIGVIIFFCGLGFQVSSHGDLGCYMGFHFDPELKTVHLFAVTKLIHHYPTF